MMKLYKKALFVLLFGLIISFLISSEAFAEVTHLTISENAAPVFATLIGDQAYVIKDNVNYKMYYVCGTDWGICLAQSPDGITWTPYGTELITGEGYHSDVKYFETSFSGANSGTNPSSAQMNYRMWYQGTTGYGVGGWRYAESPDGINWFNRMAVSEFGTPVWSVGTGVTYGIANAVYTPGASNTGTDWTFRIYANVQWELGPYSARECVILAFSPDGYNWTGYDPTSAGYATPIFGPSLIPGDFDKDHVGWFKVIKNSDFDWQAFYSGGGSDTTYQSFNGIGYATSTDGINWTRKQTLFTTNDPVSWRNQSTWMPSVVKIGDVYKIWFLGSDNEYIAQNDEGIHATSDWIQWRVGSANLYPPSTPIPSPTSAPGLPSTGINIPQNNHWGIIIISCISFLSLLFIVNRKKSI